jgi:hypothetical protein
MCEHAEISFEDPRIFRQSKNKRLPKLRDGAKERTTSFTQKYRFGFNNQEQETELGEYYSFEYADDCWVLKKPLQCRASTTINRRDRVHDAQLGRFLSVYPLEMKYSWQSPFAYYKNSPIVLVDLLGLGGPGNPNGAGQPITFTIENQANVKNFFLPDGAVIERFENESSANLESNNKEVSITPNSIRAFSFNGKRYTASWDKTTGEFLGYYAYGKGHYYQGGGIFKTQDAALNYLKKHWHINENIAYMATNGSFIVPPNLSNDGNICYSANEMKPQKSSQGDYYFLEFNNFKYYIVGDVHTHHCKFGSCDEPSSSQYGGGGDYSAASDRLPRRLCFVMSSSGLLMAYTGVPTIKSNYAINVSYDYAIQEADAFGINSTSEPNGEGIFFWKYRFNVTDACNNKINLVHLSIMFRSAAAQKRLKDATPNGK